MGGASTTKTISQKNINKVKDLKNVSSVESIYTFSNATLKQNSKKVSVQSLSTWNASNLTKNLVAGSKPGSNEIVIDKKTVAQKFDTKNWKSVVGKTISVSWSGTDSDGNPYSVTKNMKVSGVINAKSASSNIISVGTAKSVLKDNNVSTNPATLIVKANSQDNVKSISKNIKNIKSDGKQVFSTITVGDMLDTINTFVTLASSVLQAIAAISLIVSALMIIVTMYMSVSERTKEIGVLRALGESRRDIRRMFTCESIMIGLLSAILATVLGFGLGALLNVALYNIAKFTMIQITFGNVVEVFVIALIISYISALLPARRAARLNPIDALAAD